MNKYFNKAIIGNGKILATLSKEAELLRLYYPNIDYYQNIHTYSLGFVHEGENKLYLFKDAEVINEYYDGNIVYTKLSYSHDRKENQSFDTDILIRDYCLIDKNIIVRKIKFNEPLSLVVYSKLNSSPNRLISGMCIQNSLVQYCQEMYMTTFSTTMIKKAQINNIQNLKENIDLKLEDYIGMSDSSAVMYEPAKEIILYISLENSLKDCTNIIKWLKTADEEELYKSVKKYWREYLEKHLNYYIGDKKYTNKEIDIIERTILMYALLTNPETGAVLASPDVDEEFTKCGRYGYCWPRDALFINDAMILLGLKEEVKKFYGIWAKKTQLPNGLFEQRYYSNGELAPSWGMQVDETASMVIGIDKLDNKKDYKEVVEKATCGMINFLDERYISKPCYDLWEERKNVHLYSTASIYKALESARDVLKDDEKYNHLVCEIDLLQPKILEGIKNEFIQNDILIRSKNDAKEDISIIGATVPFNVFGVNEKVVENTIKKLESNLKTPNGGYFRYKDDEYIGGNAWIISSLWLALYYIELGDKNRAQELFDWVTNHSDNNGFLAEQIDGINGKPKWIVGLSWSHALYIIVGNKLK